MCGGRQICQGSLMDPDYIIYNLRLKFIRLHNLHAESDGCGKCLQKYRVLQCAIEWQME